MRNALLTVILCLSCASCTLGIKGVCVSGPNKGQPISGKASYYGFGSGKLWTVAPWGESAEGRYLTQQYGASTRAWNAQERRTGDGTEMEGEDVVIASDGNTQVGTALLLGNQGTTFDVIYWCNVWSPTHGQGRVRDSRGNRYRLVW